ncbi:iron-containing redox enzyme family protein [Candidatus Methylocalor cossyra]|uniref:Iron-containing redox enzyme n=1 Tax=Candidatus Methylocalor cossyra TaxID=3108543 RepID=A0ABM9NJN1_9GAMM
MSPLRARCQALLNGPLDPAALRAAEQDLRTALDQLGPTPSADDFGEIWTAGSLPEPEDPERRRRALLALAPTLLLDGVWLARAAQPATAHRATEGHLLALYQSSVGLDDPTRSPPVRFRARLAEAGVALPPLASPAFFQDPRLPEFALRLPGWHLGLLHRPRSFFPELLGYTFAHLRRAPAWWDALPPDRACCVLATAALDDYPQRQAHRDRIRAGWRLYRQGFAALLEALAAWLDQSRTRADAMAALVLAKRATAIGHHGRVILEGRSLDQWLAAADPEPLLRALRRSPWVDRACPSGSRLIRAMEFGGPMFGVFDAEERRVCQAWIEDDRLPAATPGPGNARPVTGTAPSGQRQPQASTRQIAPRRLFTALLRAESPGDCPPATEAVIRRGLWRARWLGPRPGNGGLPPEPGQLRAHLEARQRQALDRYRPPTKAPEIGRHFCRWALLQLAPAILVDGAWLAGIATAAENLDEVGRHLARIHADELGNGRPQWNHANVYRRLLDSLGIALPPLDSEAFAGDNRFLDAAFELPVYLLAMGQRADRYFPELLGLNLAIELSGLGGGYLGAIEVLRWHGIDPTIVALHLSIDNLASGHAARAVDAITLYLDQARRRGGDPAVQEQWRRVERGYRSFQAMVLPLAGRLLLRYGWERLRATRLPARLRNSPP